MKRTFFVLGFLAFALGSCNPANNSDSQADSVAISESSPVPDNTHTAQNSLDYTGTYTGVLPCADCQGIETQIILGADNSYVKTTTYLGKRDANIFEERGSYSWDTSGQLIALEGLEAPNQYFVGENTLIQLDMAGKKVEGDMVNLYVLMK